ncbi:hypothetical protein G6F37_009494 [Rhizopus arrhizus]|nr:hypothetical protein G6F38_009582 [Rhizopus arrhizus]KAG1154385.1 hypothetical protein G6F37_009494 [Rhizopus arrhizus]
MVMCTWKFLVIPVPNSSLWNTVSVYPTALAPFIKEALPQGYQNQLNMFCRVFNFKKLRLSMDDLTPNENNKILFGNTIKSDGFSVDFVFYRKERMNNGSDVELTLEDFNYEEVHNQYHPMFLDPGRKSLFTTVVGVASAKQIRKSSKALEMMANMLTRGTAKYNRSRRKRKKKKEDKNDKKEDEGLSLRTDEKKLKWWPLPFQENKEKCPLVVFGAGVFGKDMVKMKELRCGVIEKLFAMLKKREAAVVKTPDFKGKGVLSCSKCKKVWQRDVNAATNMMTISEAVRMGEGRPEVFKPKKNDADHVILIIVGDAADISKDDQTREHALLVFTLSVHQLTVATNKIQVVRSSLQRHCQGGLLLHQADWLQPQVCSFRPHFWLTR